MSWNEPTGFKAHRGGGGGGGGGGGVQNKNIPKW